MPSSAWCRSSGARCPRSLIARSRGRLPGRLRSRPWAVTPVGVAVRGVAPLREEARLGWPPLLRRSPFAARS
eukprot:7969756-Alexandrium_andersonii.AAC.1